jgi:hypothetical protein
MFKDGIEKKYQSKQFGKVKKITIKKIRIKYNRKKFEG